MRCSIVPSARPATLKFFSKEWKYAQSSSDDFLKVVRAIGLAFLIVGIAEVVLAFPLAMHGGTIGGAQFGALGMVVALPSAGIVLAMTFARWLIARMKFESEH